MGLGHNIGHRVHSLHKRSCECGALCGGMWASVYSKLMSWEIQAHMPTVQHNKHKYIELSGTIEHITTTMKNMNNMSLVVLRMIQWLYIYKTLLHSKLQHVQSIPFATNGPSQAAFTFQKVKQTELPCLNIFVKDRFLFLIPYTHSYILDIMCYWVYIEKWWFLSIKITIKCAKK